MYGLETSGRASDRQYGELLTELAQHVNRHGALLDQMRESATGAARDIATMRDEVKDLRSEATARFQQHLADYREGGLYRGPFRNEAAARLFGRAVIATFANDQNTLGAILKEGGVETAAMLPTSGPTGGYLMPETLVADLIRNVEDAGMFESNCPAYPVDTLKGGVPSRTSGVTVYYPDFGVAGTASSPAAGKRNFDLKRIFAAVEVENWMLSSRLAVPLANYVMTELAYAISLANDTNWFVGDASSTYCGYTGLFKSGLAGVADHGLQVVTGDSGDDTLAELVAKSTYYLAAMMGKLPLWAHKAGAKFYGHLALFFAYLGVRDTTGQPVVANILAAPSAPGAGGVNLNLMGLPFVPVQVAPTATAVSTVFLLLAALQRACWVVRHTGDVRFRTGDQVKFYEELTVFAASAAQDMVVKDGNGVVQLKTAAS